MRKKNKKIFFGKKIIIILFIIISFFIFKFCTNAIKNYNEKQKQILENKQKQIFIKKIDKLLEKIFLTLEKTKTKSEQKYIYKKLIEVLEKKSFQLSSTKQEKNTIFSFKNYIIEKIIEKNNSIYLKKINFSRDKIKILKISNLNYKKNLKNFLKENKNIKFIFIFKEDKNLSKKTINFITKKLKKINKNILIFIDQEGGLINRYVDFEKKSDIDKFFDKNNNDIFLKNRLKKFSNEEIKIIRNIFPKKYGYYPSLYQIGKTYDIFKTKEKKKDFLEIIAFIRLKTLKNNGINTYGLVLDLNRGNPVISGNSRSFSKHLWKYKELVDAFLKSSRKTGVILYGKHFPGHGAGKTDSHLGILNLKNEEKYLKENLELFDYFIKNAFYLQAGLMVGHMYIPKKLEKNFEQILEKSDFLLTDDLAMQGYKQAKNKKIKNLFFTTNKIFSKKNLIIVDTKNFAKIK